MTDKIYAPWTLEQVDALNRFQTSGHTHPFTCGRDHDIPVVLIARTDGWHCSDPACGYRQNWAPAIFAEPRSKWPARLAAAKKELREAEKRQRAEAAAKELEQQQEQAAPVDWQAIAKQRERELKQVGEARHRAEAATARVHALADRWKRNGTRDLARYADIMLGELDHPGPEETDTTPAEPDPQLVAPEFFEQLAAVKVREDEFGATDTDAYAQAVARVESSGPRPAPAATEATDGWTQNDDGTWTLPIEGGTVLFTHRSTPEERAQFAAEWAQRGTESTASPAISAGQNLTLTATPAEHCGHLSPELGLSTPRTECVLRPGHYGSHADERGARWWPVPATAATGTPDAITDPEWLREQYAAVIRRWWDADDGGAEEIAAALLAVRDRHLQQLQQRLTLADHELAQWAAAESADAAAGSYAMYAETVKQQRDQLAKLLTVILAEFRILPGTRTATAHVETETLDRWRAVLDQHQEQP